MKTNTVHHFKHISSTVTIKQYRCSYTYKSIKENFYKDWLSNYIQIEYISLNSNFQNVLRRFCSGAGILVHTFSASFAAILTAVTSWMSVSLKERVSMSVLDTAGTTLQSVSLRISEVIV